MPKPIYQHDIDRYRDDIRKHGVTGVIRVYAELLDKDYDYAGWAKGVAEASGINTGGIDGTLAGRAAVLFMKNTSGRDFTKAELDSIRIDMAKGYLSVLEGNIEIGKGKTQTDTNFDQMRTFHQRVFEKHHLSIDNWTLETPMKLIGKYQDGKAAQERTWRELAATQGDDLYSIPFNLMLVAQVREYARGYIYTDSRGNTVPHLVAESNVEQLKMVTRRNVSESDKQQAQQWLDKVSIIKPLLMSENEQEQQNQFVQTQPSFSSELQPLHEKARTLLAEFNQREGIYQSATEFDNTAAFITAAMQKAKMTDADVIGKMDGKLHVIHDTEELDVAIVDPKTAAQTPVADSVAQSKQTEQQFEYETQQRQLAQSQSRGMVLS